MSKAIDQQCRDKLVAHLQAKDKASAVSGHESTLFGSSDSTASTTVSVKQSVARP